MLNFSANLSMLFTEYPVEQRVGAACAAGFDHVEVQFPYELPAEHWQRRLQEYNARMVLINVPAGDLMQGGDGLACVPGQESAFAEAVEQAIHYATTLGIRQVNVLAGRIPEGIRRDEACRTLAHNLRRAIPRLAAAGIDTLIEAINPIDMPRFLINRFSDMQQLLTTIGLPQLKMQFDLYHMARVGENLGECLRHYWQQIGHIQFADTPGRGAPGTGTLPFTDLFNQISQLPYSGYCGAEYRPGDNTSASLGWLRLRQTTDTAISSRG